MRLKPPEITTPNGNPYFSDKLGRNEFGDSLFEIFKNIEDNSVICLDAPWGEGKTSFIKMWRSNLKDKEINTIYFDAYENDYNEDPFLSFISEILALAEKDFGGVDKVQESRKDLKKQAIKIAKNILIPTSKIALKALTYGLIDSSNLEELKNVKGDITEFTDKTFSKYVEEKIDNVQKDKDSVKHFKHLLSDLGEEIRKKQGFQLLIIIDELDRCRPDFALLLLERIKHLFSVDNVSFLIVTHLKQLKNYVQTVYGKEIDAHNYLHKFFTLTTTLPKQAPNTYSGYHTEFWKNLGTHHKLNKVHDLGETALPLFKHLVFSLREIEKVGVILTIFYSSKNGNSYFAQVVAIIAIIKVRFHELYQKLLTSSCSFDDLYSSLNMGTLSIEINGAEHVHYSISYLQFLLLTDEELEQLSEDDQAKTFRQQYRHSNRKTMLLSLIMTMEQFKIE